MELSIANRAVKYAYDKGYRVDHLGNVISSTGKARKLNTNKHGRLRFSIQFLGHSVSIRVHTLALYQKIGDALFAPDIVARHLNGVPHDNSYGNLAVGSQSDNMMDKPQEMRIRIARRAGRTRSNLSDSDVLAIRQKLVAGATLKQIMAEYGIAKSTASYIKNRRTYAYL